MFNTSMKNTRLFAVDTQGSGDNLSVKVESGEPVTKLAEWKALQNMSAQTTNSQILSDTEVSIAGKQAFTHLETYDDPALGPILYGYMEIAHGRHAVVSVAFSMDANEESVARSILASVHSAGR